MVAFSWLVDWMTWFSSVDRLIDWLIALQISRVGKMLADEFGTASNIKSRVNRLSVLGAITSVQQRLKLYNKGMRSAVWFCRWLGMGQLSALGFSDFSVPPNGLVVYCGTILTDEGKEKKVNIDFEPFKAINTSLYLCDNKFHTEVSGSWWIHRCTECFIVLYIVRLIDWIDFVIQCSSFLFVDWLKGCFFFLMFHSSGGLIGWTIDCWTDWLIDWFALPSAVLKSIILSLLFPPDLIGFVFCFSFF